MTITYEITDQILDGRLTAVRRGEIPANDMPTWLAETYRVVYEYLLRTGVDPDGPPFARFTFLGEVVVAEAGFPVSREIAGDAQVEPSALPGGPAAITIHMGRYEDLDKAYDAITRWLDARERAPSGPHWEIYYTDPNAEPDPARWRTEVVMPYRDR